MSQRWARGLLRVLGVLAVLLALAGFLYTAASLYGVQSGAIDQLAVESGTPYVRPAFYVMASVCVIFYAVLLLCGVQFVRLRSTLWWLFAAVLAAEVIFHFAVGWLWSHPTLGGSIAGATGISSGGLVFQFLLLFPLWAPVVAFLAHRAQVRHAP